MGDTRVAESAEATSGTAGAENETATSASLPRWMPIVGTLSPVVAENGRVHLPIQCQYHWKILT